MEQAYFSGIRSRVTAYLENATERIQIAMAWFTSNELFNVLLRCLSKGVEVELVLLDNAINYMEYAPDFNKFIDVGGKLRIAGSNIGFMHHKFCVIDNQIAITGSYNWTYYAETRNVENILITDKTEVVEQFKCEFLRLKSLLALCDVCQRLSWDEIEYRDDVDFRELNFEIERICEAQNKPIKRVFETKTEVVRTEIKLTPYSKYSIGIQVLDAKGNDIFYPIINRDLKLPCSSVEEEFFFDSKMHKEFPCKFLFGSPNNKNEWHIIKEVDLMQIAKNTSDENLPIKFRMILDDNGSLRVDVSCMQSGQKFTVSALDSNFVKYE